MKLCVWGSRVQLITMRERKIERVDELKGREEREEREGMVGD